MKLTGLYNLQEWLTESGFKCEEDHLRNPENECNWYAYKRSELDARRCESSQKTGIAIGVYPFVTSIPNRYPQERIFNVEVNIHGEIDGIWYKLSAYSLTPDEVRTNLWGIENALVRAWNALSQS